MALEIECKFLNVEHEALRERLGKANAQYLGRWFEANEVFDDAGRRLKSEGTLLRLRTRKSKHILTLKRSAAAQSSLAKVYEEHETEVADADTLRTILLGLCYAPVLRYEKLREKWALHGCEVCLDLLPFGQFAEIEGPEDGIKACALALGLDMAAASKDTYHELNRRHRAENGLAADESFVFTQDQRQALPQDDAPAASPLDKGRNVPI